jgi:hypothetical protein
VIGDRMNNKGLVRNNKKICMIKLREKLRKKEVKEKYESRILYSLFFSIVAVLFYIAT